ncbi:hypothetical protein D3C81_1126640 [compost metagenome]
MCPKVIALDKSTLILLKAWLTFAAFCVTNVKGSPFCTPPPPVIPGIMRLGRIKARVSSVCPSSARSISIIVTKDRLLISWEDQQPLKRISGSKPKHNVVSFFLKILIPVHLFAATNVANCSFVWYHCELNKPDVVSYATMELEQIHPSYRFLRME